jgi:hypothetical protein
MSNFMLFGVFGSVTACDNGQTNTESTPIFADLKVPTTTVSFGFMTSDKQTEGNKHT